MTKLSLLPGYSAYIDHDGRSVADVLAALEYGDGLSIESFTATPSVIETGTTDAEIALDWSISGTVTGQTLTDSVDGVIALGDPVADRSASQGGVDSTRTFTLSASNAGAPGGPDTKTATASVAIQSRFYTGPAAGTSPSDTALRALPINGFATTRARTVTYDCTGGRYPCYAWPAALGTLSSVKVGGLSFSDFTVTTRDVVNAQGAPVSMNILVFNTLQNGAAIEVQFA